MPGKSTAGSSGAALRDKVVAIGEKLGLDVQTEAKVGPRTEKNRLYTFLLVGDYCDGPWQGVIQAWHNYSGQTMTLTARKEEANVYLVTAKYPEQVVEALRGKRLGQNMPVVWINDFAMSVTEFASPNEAVAILRGGKSK